MNDILLLFGFLYHSNIFSPIHAYICMPNNCDFEYFSFSAISLSKVHWELLHSNSGGTPPPAHDSSFHVFCHECYKGQWYCYQLYLNRLLISMLKKGNDLYWDKFIFPFLQELVFEKNQRLKESMKMMGLANWIHWLAWFTKDLLFLLISIIIATVFLKVRI